MALAGILLVLSCGDGTTEPPAPDPLVPTAVVVSPATATVVEGDSLRLTATATNVYGQVVSGVEFEWASGNTAVAVVDTTGLVTGVGTGEVQVTATAAGVTGRAELAVVAPLPTTIAVTPDTVVLSWVGQTAQLIAEVLDQGGRVMDGIPVTWLSAETTIATIDASGSLTAVGNGVVTVTATAGEASGDAHVTVAIDLERAALVALYNATDGPNWADNTNWLTDAPLGEWYGVSTDRQGRVVGINLSGKWDSETRDYVRHGLRGELPVELGHLTELAQLYLGTNDLSGPIPPELGNLANLQRLDLELNGLTGAIPPELGALAELTTLNLRLNNLTGPIPSELGNLAGLTTLNLRHNSLNGPIPPELGKLAELNDLTFWNNSLTGSIPPELGSLSNLVRLDLGINDLTGPIPPELGNLARLTVVDLIGNDLTAAIPRSFLQLNLRWFRVGEQDLCVPGAPAFVAWLDGIERRDTEAGVFCNAADVAALESLYHLTDGANWTESDGWLGDNGVEDWYGVTADSLGHVTGLDLEGNGLGGRLSSALGNLARMTVLRIADNALDGRLPLSLAALDLKELHYDGTDLCEPEHADFQRWLEGIASHRGTGVQCPPLTERDVLVALYGGTGGPGWTKSDGWLSEAPLQSWHGVEVDAQGRVVGFDLSYNNLTGKIPPELGGLSDLMLLDFYGNALSGEIPPELGNLANLSYLSLSGNELTGEIPPELGNLANLAILRLAWNALTGQIPPELGNLANLWWLSLDVNALSGEIPPELGNLANLTLLDLEVNALSGEIPPELGSLAKLRWLYLSGNDLSGAIPPTFGGLASLTYLELSHNAGLAGAVPPSLRDLDLESLLASGTDLCVPQEPAFEEWLGAIPKRRIAACGEPLVAYLVQAVQSRAHPVPLVAGEDALLRVFVTAAMETTAGIPKVRARFYLNGTERHVVDIPGGSTPIPTEIDEGDLAKSANAEIPGRIVRPGLEMIVEIDPGGTLDPGLGVPKRIPEEGRLAIEVREMPALDLTVIPFLWSSDPDSAIMALVGGMAADPDGHALLEWTHVILPVADIDVTAHTPVASTSNNTFDLLRQTEAIRVLEGGGGHYMGMMSGSWTGAGGVAHLAGRSSFAQPDPGTIAHELGHNMNLRHAPCGGAGGPDPSFPYPNGAIGAWGHDFRSNHLVPVTRNDIMSYCGPAWISDYHFTNATRHRLDDEGASAAAHDAATVRSLLLWGGVGADGVPYLEPTFVVDAPAALPDSSGDYRISGRTAAGGELFSLSFTMPVTADGDGSSSFAFALPVRPGWGGSLATITLSGPGGSVTLDGESDIPMAILRDPQTGQVRGILRDPPLAGEVAADAVGAAASDLEVLFSRGIPEARAWTR